MKSDLELMGKIVTVHQEYKRRYEDRERYWEPRKRDKPRAGWVVGFRVLQNGRVGNKYGPPYFYAEKPVDCVLVTYWPTYNPVKVPPDGFTLGGDPHSTEAYNAGEYTEDMSFWASIHPRDEKGRFKAYRDWTEEEEEAFDRKVRGYDVNP